MILVIDNFDSFTYNLVQYLGEIHKDIRVFRNNAITLGQITRLSPSHIVISPGPGIPQNAGISVILIQEFAGKIRNPFHFPIMRDTVYVYVKNGHEYTDLQARPGNVGVIFLNPGNDHLTVSR